MIYNGIDIEEFPSNDAPERFAPPLRVLFVGRLIERKGLAYLLEGRSGDLKTAGSAFELEVAGDGPLLDAMRELCRKLRIDGQVKFHGIVDHKDLPALDGRAQVLAMPSLNESNSNVIMEAMASGLALIATDTGAGELIDGNGYVVPRRDSGFIAAALTKLAEAPDQLEAMARRSCEIAEKLSWAMSAETYRGIYSELAGEPEARGERQLT